MADASFLQTSFLGGEWSPLTQGRADDPDYRRGLNLCRNAFPIEEGAATRRPGFRLIAATRKGGKGVLRAFEFTQSAPFLLELTAGHLRFLSGPSLVVDTTTQNTITAISTANPAVIETATAHGLTTGDEVLVTDDALDLPNFTLGQVLGRELEITVIDTTHFSVADAVTGASVNGAGVALGTSLLTIQKIIDFATPYASADLDAIYTVQDQANLLLLQGSYQARLLQNQAAVGASPAFNFATATFADGPYLDPPTDGTTVTPSGTTGAITLTLSVSSTTFKSTDVGRMVRLLNEPVAWASGTAYVVGAQVKYNGAYYQALKANTNKQPDVDVINWGVATGVPTWTWGTITAFTDAQHVTLLIKGANLPNTNVITTWRLGVFSDTTGWPSVGVYHEGRLWLSGAVGNRLDASNSNDLFNFAPTAQDGTVGDANGISAVFNSTSVNKIVWLASDQAGILAGTQHGEWLIRASEQNDALTPTSIQAHEVTTYGCAAVKAHRASLPIVFVQRYGKKVFEYITTDYRGMTGKNISVKGKHLTQRGILELAYQREKVPVLWARLADGTLASCTFKRESPWASDPPDFNGWALHQLPGGLSVVSIQSGPSADGTLDALSAVVKRASDGKYYSLLLTDLFDVDWTIQDAMYTDFAESPTLAQYSAGPPATVTLYGLFRLAGQNVDVFFGGVDAGTLAVGADGTVVVPLTGLLTTAFLGSLTTTTNFHGLGISIENTPPARATVPADTGVLAFDTALGGDGNGEAIVDWQAATGYGVPVLFTSSAATGACALWDLTATADPPTRLAFHATNATQDISGPGCIDSKGNFYLEKITPGIVKLDKTLQTQQITNFAGLPTHNMFMPMFVGSKDYIVAIGSTHLDLFDISGASPVLVSSDTAWLTEQVGGVLGRLKVSGTHAGFLWAVGQPTVSGGSFTRQGQPLGLYKVTVQPGAVSPIAAKRVLSITAAMFGWTHISLGVDVLGDETDGNPIIWAQSNVLAAWVNTTTYAQFDCVTSGGHDFESKAAGNVGNLPTVGGDAHWTDLGVHQAVAEQNAIKINVNTGAVMWTVKMIAGLNGRRDRTRVRFGRLRLFDPSTHGSSLHWLWDIDTINAAGTLVNTGDIWNTLPSFTKQFYNDETGQWIANGSYGTSVGQPGTLTPVGGSPVNFNGWFELGDAAGYSFPLIPEPNAAAFWAVPVAIGYSYASQLQLLRGMIPAETGAQNGPAMAKTRRTHKYGALLQQTQGISFGTTFTNLHVAPLATPGGTPLAKNVLFSGVLVNDIEADNDFDNMICCQITRPYPGTVCAIEGFLHTQDR